MRMNRGDLDRLLSFSRLCLFSNLNVRSMPTSKPHILPEIEAKIHESIVSGRDSKWEKGMLFEYPLI